MGIEISKERTSRNLAKRLLRYYNRPRDGYAISGSGFLKILTMLCQDIIDYELADGLSLILDKKGTVSSEYVKKEEPSLKHELLALSSRFYLVEVQEGQYTLCRDILSALHKIAHELPLDKRREALTYVSTVKKISTEG